MIDRNTRIMMLDTETTNSIDDPIVYDLGFEVFDLAGNTYETASFINQDVFEDAELMASAYYAEKIPTYKKQIADGSSVLLPWKVIKWKIFDVCKRYNCKIIAAHNARFDRLAVNYTQRYLTTSQYRYFLPFGCEWYDTLKMAKDLLGDDAEYREFCVKNNYLTTRNQNRYTAEVLYRFITNDNDFNEVHQGLDDVKIERQILEYCLNRNPEIDGRLFTKDYIPNPKQWHKQWWNTGV